MPEVHHGPLFNNNNNKQTTALEHDIQRRREAANVNLLLHLKQFTLSSLTANRQPRCEEDWHRLDSERERCGVGQEREGERTSYQLNGCNNRAHSLCMPCHPLPSFHWSQSCSVHCNVRTAWNQRGGPGGLHQKVEATKYQMVCSIETVRYEANIYNIHLYVKEIPNKNISIYCVTILRALQEAVTWRTEVTSLITPDVIIYKLLSEKCRIMHTMLYSKKKQSTTQ